MEEARSFSNECNDSCSQREPIKQPKALLAPIGDFYHFAEALPAEELALLRKVRTHMKTKVTPIIKYWAEDSFPFQLLPLLEFIGDLFLFLAAPYPLPILFRKIA